MNIQEPRVVANDPRGVDEEDEHTSTRPKDPIN